jgi:hypothetical protein
VYSVYGDEWAGFVRRAIKEPEEGYDGFDGFHLGLFSSWEERL